MAVTLTAATLTAATRSQARASPAPPSGSDCRVIWIRKATATSAAANPDAAPTPSAERPARAEMVRDPAGHRRAASKDARCATTVPKIVPTAIIDDWMPKPARADRRDNEAGRRRPDHPRRVDRPARRQSASGLRPDPALR
nr:hypothetical protein [Burkholderia ambifaria]